MEKCKSCGHILNENDKFCPNCGEKVLKRTVIYSPKAEDIVVVEDDNTSPKHSSVVSGEKPFIKYSRLLYSIALSILAIMMTLISIMAFKEHDYNFGFYFASLTIIFVLNIFFFNKKQWKKYFLTYLGILIVTAISVVVYDHSQNEIQSTVNNPKNDVYKMTEDEYKAKCNSYDYEELARYPDKYKDEYIHIYGQAIQVVANGDNYTIRVATKPNEYIQNWTEDIIYVFYTNKKEARILENDMLDIYGVTDGLKTYTSALGTSITIPKLNAKYVDIDLD